MGIEIRTRARPHCENIGTAQQPNYKLVSRPKICNLAFHDCWVETNGPPDDAGRGDPEIRGQIMIDTLIAPGGEWNLNDLPTNIIFYNMYAQASFWPDIPAVWCNYGHRCFFYHSRVTKFNEIVFTGNHTTCDQIMTWSEGEGRGNVKTCDPSS
jgi:hypothetical protein